MIVEWNAHLFSCDRERYPLHPEATYLPQASACLVDPLGSYLERMNAVGIDRAVVVQPEPYRDDHRLLLDALEREPTRLKGACLILPKHRYSLSKLEDLVAYQPRIIALRFHAHRGKELYLHSFYEKTVRALWQRAGELGLVIELHIGPNYARQIADVVRDFPDFPVLIDHMAEPQFGEGDEYKDVLDLGQFRNITMKMSGLSHFSKEPEPHLDVKPLVQQVAAAFGPDRLAWSGGSPNVVDVLLDHWPAHDRAKVKGENLARLAKFV